LRGKGRVFFIDALRTAGKDERLRTLFFEPRNGRVEGPDLRVNTELADLSGDELRVLRPEIEDEDFVHAVILSDAPLADKGRHRRKEVELSLFSGHLTVFIWA